MFLIFVDDLSFFLIVLRDLYIIENKMKTKNDMNENKNRRNISICQIAEKKIFDEKII